MAGKCLCDGNSRLIMPCSGASDVGALSDKVARQLMKEEKGDMFCLAGIGAHIDGMIESAKSADEIIAIDGCPVACAKKTLEHAGFTPKSFILTKLGFKKGKTEVSDKTVQAAISKLDI